MLHYTRWSQERAATARCFTRYHVSSSSFSYIHTNVSSSSYIHTHLASRAATFMRPSISRPPEEEEEEESS